jgi:23S rRNA pseudouridine1911/1915/1917 synthase
VTLGLARLPREEGRDFGVDVHLHADGRPRIIERRFRVDEALAGQRLDHFLLRKIPRLSRTKLQRIIETALTRSSGGPTKPSASVMAKEEIVIRQRARPEPPCPRWFDVLHDDPSVLVVDKPAGLPVHASAKFYFNTLTRLLLERYPDQPLQIAHRLDRETSGCLVIARGKAAAAWLKTAFCEKRVSKAYLAIVHGDPPWPDSDDGIDSPAHTIDAPLMLVAQDRVRVGVRMEVRPDGLASVTRVSVVRRVGDRTLVRCVPLTGRQHQIRAHLAWAGHPVVGDKLYAHGDEAFAEYCARGLTEELRIRFELPRQALHAAVITFPHPATRRSMTIESSLPVELASYLAARASAAPSPG